MKFTELFGFIGVVFGSSFSTIGQCAVVDNVIHSCNGCSSAQVDHVAATLGKGDHYIYDLTGNILYRFDVECEPSVGGITCYPTDTVPDASVAASFGNYHGLWIQNLRREDFTQSLQYFKGSGDPRNQLGQSVDDGFINAFDTIYEANLSPLVTADLADPNSYSGLLSLVISASQNLPTGDYEGFNLTVTVHFHDGSSRVYQKAPHSSLFEPVPNTALDSQGNRLPENGHNTPPQHYSFNANFPPFNYNPGNVAVLLGALPPDISSGVSSCYWDGVKSLTCTQPN